ncbi:hypothetical protein [Xenorhabdus bovienii]|uniref:hypothetical protein n=1 Tax=Xenorhabdus bovienii TaxID=40576 RepID=UPI00237C7A92|nr:hypothetical protein [Xenorhabdus bovienii]MDE1484148.1 hypothetical protein [Xenorhabdus bovienii]MDE1492607.1 hypothetical protein [Xenorhabdus bovienii]MDE9442973.1 hypothetical protein [Xenorhabdus bovienii]MDE9537161.1 hypothetical protein [Xenorhabdus bovienii]MDE9590183.1 hypothetical protein [Xenorhabdus bovienii]
MIDIKKEFILEPMTFLLSEKLLFGSHGSQSDFYVEIRDPELALTLAFEQLLPNGYVVWSDVIDNSIGKFRLRSEYDDANEYLNDIDEMFSVHQSKISISYRKKKIKKENSNYDDFYFEILDEVYYQLKMLSLQRYILGGQKESILEKIFEIYKEGVYPCGMTKDKKIVAFNPMVLKNS